MSAIQDRIRIIRNRAIELTVAADKAGIHDDDLAEVRFTAQSEALVWALSIITGQDEAQIQVDVLMATTEYLSPPRPSIPPNRKEPRPCGL
jgi:hypothetical protein